MRETLLEPAGKRVGLADGADQSAHSPDHRQNARDVPLIETMDGDACFYQLGDDVGLKIGESEDQIGFERENLRDVGRGKGRDARLLLAHLRWPHRIARYANDAVLLADEVERLHGLLGQADDAFGRVSH